MNKNTTISSDQNKPNKKIRKRLFHFSSDYWNTDVNTIGQSITTNSHSIISQSEQKLETPTISQKNICTTCSLKFSNLEQQRDHFKTDWHKYNLQRKLKGRSTVTESEFDQLSDLDSIDSLSGSESEDDEEHHSDQHDHAYLTGKLLTNQAQKLEFPDPFKPKAYIVVWKAALPDETTLSSLPERGSWAVIMTGGGHFCAAIWDKAGQLTLHKTFHRYTSRRKQGGSQAAADSARGNANRIRSAGATLRRYGEQSLQREVQDLLKSWRSDLNNTQCIYIRAGRREKQDLLVGWTDSPLRRAEKENRLRAVPFPTRRPTLKEATRVYEELSTVVLSPVSEASSLPKSEVNEEKKPSTTATKSVHSKSDEKSKSTTKGTDHLKKREPEDKKTPKQPEPAPNTSEEIEKDPQLEALFAACLSGEEETITKMIEEFHLSETVFPPIYFPSNNESFKKVERGLSLIGVAAVSGQANLVEWLMDRGVSPAIGASPYVSTKSKHVRTTLRTYWGKNPDKYDYAKAEIPSPLTETDLQAQQEREREKRRKEREKKKEKARQKAEDAKPQEQKDRELRAAAAEARMLGNRCAVCKKNLDGLTPFTRLAYKYCSTACVNSHREQLDRMNSRKK